MILFIDDGAAAPAFPVIEEITQSTFATLTTAHVANYPATVNSGDLLLYFVTARGATNVDITTPSGVTFVDGRDSGNVNTTPVAYYSRVADGTEGGGTVDFVTSINATMAVQIWRIKSGSYGARLNNFNTGLGNTIVGTSAIVLSPPGPGLGIAWFGSNGAAAPTTWPLPDNRTNTASGGTSCRVNSCSENKPSDGIFAPGSFVMAVSTNSASFTIFIRSV